MIRVVATNWKGIEMVNETFETELEASNFVSDECFDDWSITIEKEE